MDKLNYLYAALVVLAPICALEKRINTEDPIRLFGLFLAAVGALVALSGRDNLMVWIGVVIVILTYLIDLWDYARGKPYERRKKESRETLENEQNDKPALDQ